MATNRPQRRGPWVPDEDQRLLDLVSSQGAHNWVRIAQHMSLRSPKQCRERYHQNLKSSLNHDPISPGEGAMIEQLVNEKGKRWADIARVLGNRSDNAVKNWWNGSQNRRKRNAIQNNKALSHRIDHRPISRPPPILPPIPNCADHESRWNRSFPSDSSYLLTSPNEYHDRFQARPDYGASWTDNPSSFEPKDQVPPTLQPPSLGQAFHSHRPTNDHRRSPFEHTLRQRNDHGHCQHRLPPMLPLPTSRTFEAPLVSPAYTDVSQAPSMDRAPSLVSDHSKTSSTSVSPKTISSPRPDGLPPINTSDPQQTSAMRRGSAPCLERNSLPHLFNGDEGYVSALPPSGTTERGDWKPQLPLPPPHRHQYSRSDSTNTLPRYDLSQGATTPTSAKDQRMNVRDLLN
ncbi:MAG: hypothetical protein Q9160_001732 [Pyrenula sp. 1 TL-2023]